MLDPLKRIAATWEQDGNLRRWGLQFTGLDGQRRWGLQFAGLAGQQYEIYDDTEDAVAMALEVAPAYSLIQINIEDPFEEQANWTVRTPLMIESLSKDFLIVPLVVA